MCRITGKQSVRRHAAAVVNHVALLGILAARPLGPGPRRGPACLSRATSQVPGDGGGSEPGNLSALAHKLSRGSAAHAAAYTKAERLWLELGHAVAPEEAAAAHTVSAKRRRKRALGVVSVVLAAALGWSQLSYLADAWFSDYRTGIGEQSTVTLPDGSTVVLNTDTAIALDFGPTRRRIRLRHGQALFTVAGDGTRGFEVEARGTRTRAIGTAFEVAILDGDAVSVTVQEHAVEVQGPGSPGMSAPRMRAVRAGERVEVSAETGLGVPEAIDLAEVTAWQRGRWVFKGQPLKQVIAEINRYRRGRVWILDEGLKALRVTGVFPINDPDAVLRSIEGTLGLRTLSVGSWLVFVRD